MNIFIQMKITINIVMMIKNKYLSDSKFMNSDFVFKLIDLIDDIYYYVKNENRSILNCILTYSNFEIIKYLFDKTEINFEFIEDDDCMWKPIIYICRFCSDDVIKYAIDKGLDIKYLLTKDYIKSIPHDNLDVVINEFINQNIEFDYTNIYDFDLNLTILDVVLIYCSENTIRKVLTELIKKNDFLIYY